MSSRVQGGAAARPWWHNPDLDMPVEDIATFYRDHTQKLGKIQKQKEKERKKEQRKKARKARKRARGEATSSSDNDSSTDGSDDYDSDMEENGLDLNKEIRPLAAYSTRSDIMDNVFKIVKEDIFQKMVPEKFRHLPTKQLKDQLLEFVKGMSRKRLNHVIQYGVDMDYSSGESDVDSEDELEKLKDERKRRYEKPIQSNLIDSTEDLVVPRPEDLDKMSLEEITALREKIKARVEQVQQEELTSQAKKMDDDDEYDYQWAEPVEEQDEQNMGPPPPPPVKEESSSEEEESEDDDSSDDEMSDIQLKLRAKALVLARAKIAVARKAKAEAEAKKVLDEEARQERLKTLQEDDDSDVSVDRDEDQPEPMEQEPSSALVSTEQRDPEAPEFEYATGMAEDITYHPKSPEALPEPEKSTEELQAELQHDLKQRALRSMNKRKFERLKAKAQAVESSSEDDDDDEEQEAVSTEVVGEKKEEVLYRSAFADEEKK